MGEIQQGKHYVWMGYFVRIFSNISPSQKQFNTEAIHYLIFRENNAWFHGLLLENEIPTHDQKFLVQERVLEVMKCCTEMVFSYLPLERKNVKRVLPCSSYLSRC